MDNDHTDVQVQSAPKGEVKMKLRSRKHRKVFKRRKEIFMRVQKSGSRMSGMQVLIMPRIG
jgi:hypothetical protein